MILIREYQPTDLPRLEAIHAAQGIDFPMPDLANPLYICKVLAEAEGAPQMAILVRITSEAYLLMDRHFDTATGRWVMFRALHEAAEEAALRAGLADVNCWVPPPIAKAFGRRLTSLGWNRYTWPCFAKDLERGELPSLEAEKR